MKFKALTAAIIAILLSNFALFATPDDKNGKAKKKQGDRLVSILPASDAVAVFEAKRFLDEGLPRLLSANTALLGRITEHIDMIRDRAGIDVRKFNRVAVGVAYQPGTAGQTDFQPVLIATAADVNLDALIAAARASASGTSRTETFAGKSIFIFKVDPAKVAKPAATPAGAPDAFDRMLAREIAVTAIDKDTIAVGTLERVKETLGGKSHVSAEIAGLLASEGSGVMSFAMRPPGGMAKLVPLESDDLGKTINSIQYLAGFLDLTAAGTALHVTARTKTPADALSLRDTLEFGQSIGKVAFANKKRPDQQVYYRLIDSAKIGMHAADVTIDVTMPQADIDLLVAGLK